MSVEVSYKKQFTIMFLLFLTLLVVVEVIVNAWLYFYYRCDFEDDVMFQDMEKDILRNICIENIGLEYNQKLVREKGTSPEFNPKMGGEEDDRLPVTILDKNKVYLNSEGFRSPEFSPEKSQNTYRIFIIGASTTFGTGVLDHQTFPFYLRQMYNETELGFDVEIINAGWPSYWSKDEVELIKTRLLAFYPDLFIVYDGSSELIQDTKFRDDPNSPTKWKERWMEICNLGDQYHYDTIILLQPMTGSGTKIMTEQEFKYAQQNKPMLQEYPKYIEQLEELKQHCSLTADLRGIFDYIPEPIYYDSFHTGPRGNQIIAENIYYLSFPIVTESGVDSSKTDSKPLSNLELEFISTKSNTLFEKFYYTLKNVISPYKTPRTYPLIFEQ